MHSRTRLFSLVFAIIAVATLAFAASARAQASVTQSNETVPINFITVDCNGQTILADGDSHVVQHSVVDANGTVHFSSHIDFHLKAVTIVNGQEVRHTINESVESQNNFVGATTFSSVGSLHANTSGSTDNLVIRTTIHTTVNANGEVTASSFEFETECRG